MKIDGRLLVRDSFAKDTLNQDEDTCDEYGGYFLRKEKTFLEAFDSSLWQLEHRIVSSNPWRTYSIKYRGKIKKQSEEVKQQEDEEYQDQITQNK